MAAGGPAGVDPQALAMLAHLAEQFAVDGFWDHAVRATRAVLDLTERLAAADPSRPTEQVRQARDRLDQVLAGAAAAGVVGAGAGPAPTTVVRDLAAVVAAGGSATDVVATAGRALTAELDQLPVIPRDKLRRADLSVRAAVDHARRLPTGTAREVAEKLARYAVLLRRFDLHEDAHDVALAAARIYEQLGEQLTAAEDGFRAYCLLILADGWLAGGEPEVAGPLAEHSVGLFMAYLGLLTTANLFDLTRALTIQAECQRQLGWLDEARQSIVDAKAIADRMQRTVPGAPGSVPAARWGLPVVPSEDEQRDFFGPRRGGNDGAR